MRRSVRRAPILTFAVALAVCRAPEPQDREERPARATKREARRPATPPPSGRIEGIVRYEGDLPGPLPVTMTGPHAADCASARGVYELGVVRGPEGGLANAFVAVENVSAEERGSPTVQTRTVVIDGCVIKPYVMNATVGDTLEVRNEDDHIYLCRLLGTPQAILQQAVLAGQSTSFVVDSPGGRGIDCTQDHPWLKGHLLVSPHPFHAVTTASGRFTIDHVPAGRRHVQAWHPTLGSKAVDTVVLPGAVARVEIVFRAPARAPGKAPLPAAARRP